MKRTTLSFVALALLLGGCGTDAPADRSDEAAEVQAGLEADVEALRAEVDSLAADLGNLRAYKEKVGTRFERFGQRFRAALEGLRASLAEAKSAAGTAASESGDAIARAEQVARDLAVLEQRYEVHMRRYHER